MLVQKTLLGGEAAVNFLQNVFVCVPELPETSHDINRIAANSLICNSSSSSSISSLLVEEVIIDAIETLHDLTVHNAAVSLSSLSSSDDFREPHWQLLKRGFKALRSALLPSDPSHPSHLLPKSVLSLCNAELQNYLETIGRAKLPSVDDIHFHTILIFPTIIRKEDT